MSLSAQSSMGKYLKLGSSGPTTNTTYAQIVANKPPWAIYSAADFNNTTKILSDSSGNGRHATCSTNVTNGSGSGNGASASIPYISGAPADNVAFPANSIPTNFTVCSITRYSGATTQRILQSNGSNWLHGHWTGNRTCFYNSTFNTVSNISAGTNWVTCCGKASGATPGNIIMNNVAAGTSNSVSGIGTGLQMSINPTGSSEKSHFSFAYLIIWDQVLTNAELAVISQTLTNYLSTGTIS